MSINAVTNSASSLLAPRPDTAANNGIGTPARANGANTLATALTNGSAKDAYTASAAPTLGARAPEGTDPGLWSVLTSEERNFFARTVTSGPLTYSRVMLSGARATPAPAARGGRIDIRA